MAKKSRAEQKEEVTRTRAAKVLKVPITPELAARIERVVKLLSQPRTPLVLTTGPDDGPVERNEVFPPWPRSQ